MKKRISLIGLVFLLIFSFTGCGNKTADNAPKYDENMMYNTADSVISAFTEMDDAQFEVFENMSELQLDLTLLSSELPIQGKDFIAMIESWKAGVDECGSLTAITDFTFEVTKEGADITYAAQFAERDADIIFNFDEKMNLETMTVNAHYSIGEILQKAGLNTILGMGTVFVVLIFISFIISLFKYIPVIEKKFSKKKTAAPAAKEAPKAAPAPVAAPATAGADEELVAVISAAIAAAEGTSTDGFIVRSIKRRKSNKWS